MAEARILGRNPVLEALKAGRPIHRLYLARGAAHGSIRQIRALAREQGIPVQEVDRAWLDAMVQGAAHQGVVAVVAARPYATVEAILARARERGEEPLVLILDGIEDPQNLGSLIRTADACGVHGIIVPERRSAGLTETVAKVSAGAIEYVPVARVTNLVRTIGELKAAGLWICGTHQEARESCYEARLTGPLGLVIGSEGKGMHRLVAEHCDFTVRIPMYGRINSLNAAVAGGILLYEIRRQRALAQVDPAGKGARG
ncbi:MAG: 23S rRNA (guanosine(2251)-2'-O)-methyltransferase RlmB [Bacillota bacterium]|nr:MAG: 23S rRNA (guanosine(2251)-2'-O)-methyltransferase RlmB [Bacillota bacterium]